MAKKKIKKTKSKAKKVAQKSKKHPKRVSRTQKSRKKSEVRPKKIVKKSTKKSTVKVKPKKKVVKKSAKKKVLKKKLVGKIAKRSNKKSVKKKIAKKKIVKKPVKKKISPKKVLKERRGRVRKKLPASVLERRKQEKASVSEVESTADRSAMQIYLKQIEKIPLLTPDEEIELSKSILSADRKAKHSRERMIRSNLRLVISIAKRYTNLGLLFSDLVEEGNIGLMRAVEKFNWRRGYRFSTYASWWIKQAIMRSISNHGKTIRIPVYMFDTISKFRKIKEALTQKLGHPPTSQELAKKMKCTPEKIDELQVTLSAPSSLNAPISLEKSAELIEVIEDKQVETPHDVMDAIFRTEKVKELLSVLGDRERQILIRRYGLETQGEIHTLDQIARDFNITRERVRQIEVLAIEKIRESVGKVVN